MLDMPNLTRIGVWLYADEMSPASFEVLHVFGFLDTVYPHVK